MNGDGRFKDRPAPTEPRHFSAATRLPPNGPKTSAKKPDSHGKDNVTATPTDNHKEKEFSAKLE